MQLRALCFTFALAFAFAAGCKRSPKTDPALTERPAAVPAPDGLLGELVVAHPDRTWEEIRTTIGGGPLVPNSPAVFLNDLLGLPLAALDQLDLLVPMVGALADQGDDVAVVIGIHVKDGARFVELVTAQGGRFTKGATEDGVSAIAPVAAKAGAFSYAVAGNYLVVAQNREALRRFAPYVTRTLPLRSPPSEDLVATASHKALAGPFVDRLKKMWDAWKKDREAEDVAMRSKHGGSAPDFGDPAQALADIDAKAAKFFAIVCDLR